METGVANRSAAVRQIDRASHRRDFALMRRTSTVSVAFG